MDGSDFTNTQVIEYVNAGKTDFHNALKSKWCFND